MLEENYSRVQFGRASRAWERFRALAESTRILTDGNSEPHYSPSHRIPYFLSRPEGNRILRKYIKRPIGARKRHTYGGAVRLGNAFD